MSFPGNPWINIYFFHKNALLKSHINDHTKAQLWETMESSVFPTFFWEDSWRSTDDSKLYHQESPKFLSLEVHWRTCRQLRRSESLFQHFSYCFYDMEDSLFTFTLWGLVRFPLLSISCISLFFGSFRRLTEYEDVSLQEEPQGKATLCKKVRQMCEDYICYSGVIPKPGIVAVSSP